VSRPLPVQAKDDLALNDKDWWPAFIIIGDDQSAINLQNKKGQHFAGLFSHLFMDQDFF
jgi:hypothetical protein